MRILQKLSALVLGTALLAGCAAGTVPSATPAATAAPATTAETAGAASTLRVVTTIFPVYDWVQTVAGAQTDHLQITRLLDGSTDLHSYQPSAADVAAIAGCDLFVYVGGASDAWVEEALAQSPNPRRRVINLMELLGSRVYTEETVEGMEPEADHDDHDHGEEETDEHIWTSLRNAAELSAGIADVLGELDPAHAADYTANAADYGAQLNELDARYAAAVEAAPGKTLLFADRFPFRYLVEDYGLSYYAAFPGCSAETEASFETVAFLAEKTAALDLPAVLTIEGSDGQIARTVAETAGGDRPVLTMDALQGTVPEGATYLSVMEDNLAVLRRALGAGEVA